MKITPPLIFLTYDEKRIFSVENEDGVCYIPVFMDAERAKAYSESLGIDLQTRLVLELEKAANLFEVVRLVDRLVEFVVVDPFPPAPNNRLSAIELEEFVRMLRQSIQKPDSPRPLHTKPDQVE